MLQFADTSKNFIHKKYNIMEATCKNCNHWEQQDTEQQNLGECEVLGVDDNDTMYVLPVIEDETKENAHIMTSADFGCNQFSA